MSRFLAIDRDVEACADLGLALISGSALMQRHAGVCRPGFWAIRHFERNNHRVDAPAHAVIDDFGTLTEVFP